MIDFWLVRHGETIENAAGICQGHNEGTLSELGKEQAGALAHKLKNEHFDHYYSSDLKRTLDTMQSITQWHQTAIILREPLLRERYMADWQGKTFPANWRSIPLPKSAETVEDLLRRATDFLFLLKEKHPNQKILAMSHGGMVRAFWTVLNRLPVSGYYQWDTPKNTCINRFILHDDDQLQTLLFNNDDHLSEHSLQSKRKSAW